MPPRDEFSNFFHDVTTMSDSYVRRVSATPPRRFKDGARVRLIPKLGGDIMTVISLYRAPDVYWVRAADGIEFVIDGRVLLPAAPTWQPGDVVVVKFENLASATFTYVRGRDSWPSDGGRPPKSDAIMNSLYSRGKLTPVLQSGGVPFDTGRLA